jgi:hypothetical protein
MRAMSVRLICVSAVCFAIAGCGGTGVPGSNAAANLPVVAAGFQTTCVMGPERRLACYGQSVGDGTQGSHVSPATPQGIGTIKAVALSAFLPFGCVIVGDPSAGRAGPVWCWTGAGTASQVQNLADATDISVGGPGACAVLTDTTVRCWSLSFPGESQNFVSSFFPAMPSMVQGLANGILQVSVGQHFACAVNSTNQVVCWGRNDAGQLGRGTVGAATDPELDARVPVTNLSGKWVAAGTTHACAIARDNTIKCWGQSDSGQLGNGVNANMFVPTPQTVSGISNAVNVAASAAFTCATLADQSARCWGQNLPTSTTAGTLGVGLLIGSASPGPPPSITFEKPKWVSMPLPVRGLAHAIFISTGATHACASGLGLMVRCWGSNSLGQLADGTTNDSLVPVPQ